MWAYHSAFAIAISFVFHNFHGATVTQQMNVFFLKKCKKPTTKGHTHIWGFHIQKKIFKKWAILKLVLDQTYWFLAEVLSLGKVWCSGYRKKCWLERMASSKNQLVYSQIICTNKWFWFQLTINNFMLFCRSFISSFLQNTKRGQNCNVYFYIFQENSMRDGGHYNCLLGTSN